MQNYLVNFQKTWLFTLNNSCLVQNEIDSNVCFNSKVLASAIFIFLVMSYTIG